MAARTQTTTQPPALENKAPRSGVIFLELEPEQQKEVEKKEPPKPKIKWAEDVVDNEHLRKRKSNACCIYHKKHGEDSSSSDTCTSDDQTNRLERQPINKQKHKLVCSKRKHACSRKH